TNSWSGAVTLGANSTVAVDAGSLTMSGATGDGALGFGLTKAGAGTLTFSGTSANTYTGATTVNAGELDLGKTAGVNAVAGGLTIGDGTGTDVAKLLAANQIADASSVTVNSSGTCNMNSLSETISSLTLNGASLDTGTATLS